jgi:hypothetical protein
MAHRSIRSPRNDRAMFLVTVVCSDPDCLEEREVAIEGLDAIESHVCECGHGFVVVAVSELDEAPRGASVVALPRRRRSNRRAA